MRTRLNRVGLGLVSYLMFLGPLVYAVRTGWTELSLPVVGGFAIYALVVNAVFYLLVRSGWSLRLKDPSMTLAQMILPLILALFIVRHAGQTRPVFLMIFVTAFFFGVFGLSRRQFTALTLGTLVAYIGVVGSKLWSDGVHGEQLDMEVLQFMALSIMLGWLTLVGSYVARLRLKMAAQKNELGKAVARLETIASHDELTGIYNRRHMIDLIEHEKSTADRFGSVFCVSLLDIDFFKKINDTYGHQVGDEVLQEFSNRLMVHSRKVDWVGMSPSTSRSSISLGRYGGEEFVLVMPHTSLPDAKRGVDRLRAAIMDQPMNTSVGELSLTFSGGVAQYRHGEQVQELLARADQGLYQAKANGRNRTEAI